MWTKKNDDEKYPHKHRCELDGEGTGVTVHTSNGPVHTHDVINYEIQEYKGHTHEMQDGSSDIRGYGNTSGEKKVEVDDKPGVKSIKEKMDEKKDEKKEGAGIEITVKVTNAD
jgi:hypothetical protein